VLLVTPWYPPTIGGVATVAERLHRLFLAAGVVSRVWLCDGQAHGRVDPDGRVIYRWIPDTAFYTRSARAVLATLARAPFALWEAYRIVRRHGIRTVVLVYPTGYAWPFIALRMLGVINLVSSCHGNEILKFATSSGLATRLFRAVLRRCDAITVPAAHLIPEAAKLLPDRTLPIWLIPNCVDDTYFVPKAEARPTNGPSSLIHISAFTPRKRTLDIVRAFALARGLPPDCRLVMVGIGPEYEAARALATSEGVAERVDFIGAPDDVRPYLWNADVLVMASDEESGPLTLLEAMACEVPWIMTPWGIAMTLPRGEYGEIVPGRAPDRLAATMEQMLSDRPRLRAMGARGRLKVEEAFGQARYLERHLDLLRAVERGEGDAAIDYSAAAVAAPLGPVSRGA